MIDTQDGPQEVSPGYLFEMDESPVRANFEKFGRPEDFIEAVDAGDREHEVLKALIPKITQGKDDNASYEPPDVEAAFLKKCEIQVSNFQFAVGLQDGKIVTLRFNEKDKSNNIAAYKKLRRASPEVRKHIEGALDEAAHRDTPAAKEFAGTGGTGALDLTDLGNA